MKTLSIFVIAILMALNGFAGIVPEKEAEKVAKNHFYQSVNSFLTDDYIEWDNIYLTCILNAEKDKDAGYYIFNVNDDNGFVIVSSHYAVSPVLAYSFEAGFNIGDIAPGQQIFLDYYSKAIQEAHMNDIEPEYKVLEKWNSLKSYNYKDGFKQKQTVGPLLFTKWHQRWPYNAMLPEHPEGPSGHVYVGCAVISMVQIMKYYNYPVSGEGSHTHTSSANGGHGDVTVNFASHTYNWDNIPNVASGEYNEDLAKINFHGGVAGKVYWTHYGTGGLPPNLFNAFTQFFKYSTDITLEDRSDYNDNEWKNILRGQFDNGQPVYYIGSKDNTCQDIMQAHAWNCDGYQGENHFHMNWGWGGNGNGFYDINNLTVGTNAYNFCHEIFTNIYPRENFPVYCEGTKTITNFEGTIEDGSSNMNYLPNTNCTYIINPECGAIIELDFYNFDLANGAEIEIYNGNQSLDILLSEFDSNNAPSNTIVADRGAMTINFVSDGQEPTAAGWKADYSVSFCKTNIMLTEASGSFDDGSGICEYKKSSVCSWIIQPEDANFITIEFEEFDLAGGADFVKVFKNSISSANTIATFTAANPPGEAVYVDAGLAIIQFFADAGDVAQGWKVNYESGTTLVDENITSSNLMLVPNPGNINSQIIINIEENSTVNLSVYDLSGKKINAKTISLNAGQNNIRISDIVNGVLENGAYFINAETENEVYTKKFIVVE